MSILNFRIRSVSSIGGLIAATLFADTISASQKLEKAPSTPTVDMEIPTLWPVKALLREEGR